MIVKFCGFTRADDAAAAVALGVDLVGMVFAPSSPRLVTPEVARDIVLAVAGEVRTVGVFVDQDATEILAIRRKVGFDIIQLHGNETPEECARLTKALGPRVIKAFRGAEAASYAAEYGGVFARLFDAPRPGAGEGWDWGTVATVPRDRPVLLAGGLTAANLERAVSLAGPDGVDVASGVESAPGIKDLARMHAFLQVARTLGAEVEEDDEEAES